jgi:hypothetical protein
LPSVVLGQVKQIEEIEAHRDPAAQVGRGMLDLQALLELREAGDAALECDDFAVGDEARRPLAIEGRHELRVPFVQSRSVPRKELQAAAAAEDETAHAVQLRLEQPTLPRKGLVRECRKHRRHPGRWSAFAEPGPEARRQRLQRIPLCPRNRGSLLCRARHSPRVFHSN